MIVYCGVCELNNRHSGASCSWALKEVMQSVSCCDLRTEVPAAMPTCHHCVEVTEI
jgi:hypothetical protein